MESYRAWYDAHIQSLNGLPATLASLRPSQEWRREDLQKRLEDIAPLVRALTLDQFARDVVRPSAGSVLRLYKKVSEEIRDAADPRTEIEDCREGVLYRVHCRNSNCGIWIPAVKGFQIARNKFDSEQLFVEYHWDCGGPFGSARPYEVLEELPAFENDAERLSYLIAWRTKRGSY